MPVACPIGPLPDDGPDPPVLAVLARKPAAHPQVAVIGPSGRAGATVCGSTSRSPVRPEVPLSARTSRACWGFWLNAPAHLHLAFVGTDRACH